MAKLLTGLLAAIFAVFMFVGVGIIQSPEDKLINEFVEEVSQNESAEVHIETLDGEKTVFIDWFDETGEWLGTESYDVEKIKTLEMP